MSDNETRNRARLLNIAVAFLSTPVGERPKARVAPQLARDALELAIVHLTEHLDAITGWTAAPCVQERLNDNRQYDERDRRYKREPAFAQEVDAAAKARTDAHALRQAIGARISEGVHKKANERKRFTDVGRAVVSLFETTTVGGRPIGLIWYDELIAVRRESLFAASLVDQLIRFGVPPSFPVQVKDLVTERELKVMVEIAKKAADAS